MNIRLGARMAARAAREDIPRFAALCLVGALVTVAVLMAVSASSVRSSEQHRSATMNGVLSDEPKPSDLLVLATTKRIADRRIDVSYVETLGEDPVRPVGVDELPKVGTAVVSPALRDLLDSDQSLSDRFVVEGTIRPAGVVSGSQLLAYVRVSPGTLSQDGTAILHARDGEYAGLGPVDRVESFGGSKQPDAVTIQGTGLSDITLEPTHVQAVWVLAVCPGLVLLWVGLGISSEPRTRRLALLQFLGVAKRARILISTVESLIPILLGVTLACVAWLWVSRRAWLFSGAEYQVFPGDASMPLGRLVLVGVTVVAVAAALATAMTAVAKGPRGTRPVQEQAGLNRWAGLPAGLAVGLLLAATVTSTQVSGLLALVGSVLAAVSIPLLMPGMLRSAGGVVARAPAPGVFLTGKFMGFDPVSTSRPFAGLATLIVLAGSGAGWITVANYVEVTSGSATGTQVSLASWRTPSVDDVVGKVRAELPGLLVTGFSVTGDRITLATTCESVAAAAVDVSCSESGALAGAGTGQLLRGLQATSGDGPGLTSVAFAPESGTTGPPDATELLVIGSGDGVAQDSRVEAAIGGYVEVPTVDGMSNSLVRPSPLVPWIGFGLAIAAILLGVGCLLLVSDRFRHVMTQHRALHLVGLTRAQLRQVARLLFTVPYIVTAGVGLLLAVITCVTISAPVGVPWETLGWLLALIATGGLLTGAMLPRRVRLPRVE